MTTSPFTSNPMITLWLQRKMWLTLRRTLWLGFALGLVSVWINTTTLMNKREFSLSPGLLLMFMMGWALASLVPFGISLLAMTDARIQIRPERWELIYMTPLSNRRLVRALVFHALFRQRLMLLTLVALLPFMVLPLLDFALVSDSLYTYTPSAPPSRTGTITSMFVALSIAGLLWGMNGVGAAFGVRMALLRKSAALGACAAPLLTLGSLCGGCCAFNFVMSSLLPLSTDTTHEVAIVLLISALLAVLPVVLAEALIRNTAQQWQRERAGRYFYS